MIRAKSFQRRLTSMMLLLLFIATGALFLVTYQLEKRILIDQIRQRALLMGKTLEVNLSELILKPNHEDLANIPEEEKEQVREFIQNFGEEQSHLEIYSENEGVHDLFFIDAHNRVIIDYPAGKEGRILPPEEQVSGALLSKLRTNEIDTQIRQRGADTILFLTFPLIQQNRVLGFGRIEMSLNSAMHLLNRLKFWGLSAVGAVLYVGLVFATYLAKRVTKPIGELVEAASRVGQGDLTQRLNESDTDNEIAVLKRAFNSMVEGIIRLEETQQRVKKLETASQLAARMAHEIKNPLNSIGLIIDHIEDRYAPTGNSDREKFRQLSENMKKETRRLDQIVEGFLQFAKPTALSRHATDLNDLAEETLALIEPQANQQRVVVRREMASGLPKVTADYGQLRQTLLNILINALQAMPDGGELFVATSNGSQDVRLAIRDTGCGIPPENLPKLFDPYFTTKVRGFGLGLATVERVVQEHGGQVSVSSELGKGTSFALSLPPTKGERDA
jgi:signal transduction histidine kinase